MVGKLIAYVNTILVVTGAALSWRSIIAGWEVEPFTIGLLTTVLVLLLGGLRMAMQSRASHYLVGSAREERASAVICFSAKPMLQSEQLQAVIDNERADMLAKATPEESWSPEAKKSSWFSRITDALYMVGAKFAPQIVLSAALAAALMAACFC